MILWLKFIHIAAISVWAAGLVSLPGIYVRRAHVTGGDELFTLQRMVRDAYVGLISPAAFVAVASGTALIFLRGTYMPWFSAKLAFVAVMVLLHALTGLVVIRLFREGERYPAWRSVAATLITMAVILAILVLVLAKPDLGTLLPPVLSEPGGLARLAERLNPWTTP